MPVTEMLRLELPLPPKELSPNFGKSWNRHMIARITQEAQDQAIVAVREQITRGKPLEHATVTVTFVVPTRGRYDKDNFIAAAKPYMDGLVKAGVIVDDDANHIKTVYPDPVYQKGIRKTIIEVAP